MTPNLAMNPLVSGTPACASSSTVMPSASTGWLRAQPAEAGEIGGAVAGATDSGDHAERADHQHRVDQQVQQHRRRTVARRRAARPVRCGLDTDEDEAGVADGRERQHALDVGLHDRHHRAADQR